MIICIKHKMPLIESTMIFLLAITVLSSCSSNELLVRYFSHYDGGTINYKYNHYGEFLGLLDEEQTHNYSSYYRVSYNKDFIPTKAQVFSKQDRLQGMLSFDSLGRLLIFKGPFESCKYTYNDNLKIKIEECKKNKDDSLVLKSRAIYRNNLLRKQEVFDTKNKLNYYVTYDYINNSRNTYDVNHILKKTVSIGFFPQ